MMAMDRLAGRAAPVMAGAPAAFAPKRSLGGIGIVVAMHLLIAWALVSGLAQRVVEVVRSPIETKLIEEKSVEPPPPPPMPRSPTTPPPTVVQIPVPEVVIPVAPPPPTVAPQAPTPAPPPAPALAAPPQPAIPVAPPAPAKAVVAPAFSADQIYASKLLEYVDTIKHYPTSREARQLRPEGTVKVWLEIDRAGQLLDSGVESSSGILLLDHEALRTVRNGRCPPFPADAFVGQGKHRFVVAMEYLRPGN